LKYATRTSFQRKYMNRPKLFMVLLGCKPPGRHTEQHDIFFGIATELKELKSEILNFWPEGAHKIHIDAWREVNFVNNYRITPTLRTAPLTNSEAPAIAEKLFFLNLGGYKAKEFEEYHYKLLTIAQSQSVAINEAKQTIFYKHFDIPDSVAHSHIDDKYGIDVDDLYEVEDILPPSAKENYKIVALPVSSAKEDTIHVGYLKLSKL
jgi:hypothetical protein